jgi:hypothetical protein
MSNRFYFQKKLNTSLNFTKVIGVKLNKAVKNRCSLFYYRTNLIFIKAIKSFLVEKQNRNFCFMGLLRW